MQLSTAVTRWLPCNACIRINSKSKFTFLFTFISSGIEKNSGRLVGILDVKEHLSTLSITVTQPEDSATYLCAVETQCSSIPCSLYPKVIAKASAIVSDLTKIFMDLRHALKNRMQRKAKSWSRFYAHVIAVFKPFLVHFHGHQIANVSRGISISVDIISVEIKYSFFKLHQRFPS